MSTGTPEPPSRSNGPWPALDLLERRVLGVLVEKQKTTPDAYPMSINGLVSGCNQKSNRDPVLNLDEDDVMDTLLRLLRRELVERAPPTGRVERWRHLLYVALSVEKEEMAVLAELLLRGPQTEGELRTRASRMDPIDDLDMLRGLLRNLVQRNLVVYLTPEDRRGAVLTHGFYEAGELERLRAQFSGTGAAAPAVRPAPVAPPAPSAASAAVADERVPALEAASRETRREITELRQQVSELDAAVAGLRRELADLKQALGV
jgi:uncharacterized protein YceH (UPF0502 family)